MIEIVEDAAAFGLAALVAVTVAVVAVVTEGAVNNPLVEMIPALVLHLICVLVEPWTTAASCWLAPDGTVTRAGVTVTVMPAALGSTTIRSPRSVR